MPLLVTSRSTDSQLKSKPAQTTLPSANDLLQRQIARRVWWSVYTLDR